MSSEIEIAHSCGKQIYCIWISGEAWAQSAPFSLLTHNYTDIRTLEGEPLSNLISDLLREVVRQLPPHFEFGDADLAQPLKDDVHLVAFGKRRIFIQSGHANTLLDVAHLLQDSYLGNDFEAFSYGKKWCLASDAFLFLPFEFVVDEVSNSALPITLHSYLQKHEAPSKLQVMPIEGEESKTAYCIMYPGEFSHSIIGVPRGKIPQLPLLEEISKSDAVILRSSGYGEICILEPDEPDPTPPESALAQLFGRRKAQRSFPKRGRVFQFTGNAPEGGHGGQNETLG